MITKTDIEIIFSSSLQALRASDLAKSIIYVYYQNNYEFLPFEKWSKQIRYQGRNVSCEDFKAYSALRHEYRLTYRSSSRNKSEMDSGHRKEARDMMGQIACNGSHFLLRDCSSLQREEHRIGYYDDFFSMFCLMLASMDPGMKFEGLCSSSNPDSYTKRHLTHVVCDECALTFEYSRGDPVTSAFLTSWTRTEEPQLFIKKGNDFPFIKVGIITDDAESLRRDKEIKQWVESVNQAHLSEGARMEMISAEPLYEWSFLLDIMLRAPSRKVCEKYRDSLIAFLQKKGYQTRVFSILRENECTGSHIEIPDSVTCIGDKAFRYNSELQSVVIPDSVTSIDDQAFMYCSSLEEVNIPDSVATIESFAFSMCTNLRAVTLPQNLKKLEACLFSGCENLESINIPAGVAEIEMSVFHNCKKLKKVVVPAKVRKIGDKVFEGCESLESVFLPKGVTEIGKVIFKNCNPDVILYGEKGSAAERYAMENGLSFAETQLYQNDHNEESAEERE